MFNIRIWIISLLLLVLLIVPATAQPATVVSFGIPDFYREAMTPVAEAFEAQNPDIDIVIVGAQMPFYQPGTDVNAYLDDLEAFTRSADVFLSFGQLNALATRSGYILNLAPLVNADTSVNPADYFAAMWESFTWDDGMWAMPIAGDMFGTFYSQSALDAAGLVYPQDNWLLNDLSLMAEQLALNTSQPLASYADIGYLSVIGSANPLFDPLQAQIIPEFNNPQLLAVLEQWMMLEGQGYFVAEPNFNNLPPLVFARSTISRAVDMEDYNFTTLPGGEMVLATIGASVSAGTAHPEVAYHFAKFLSEDEAAFMTMFGQPLPARRDFANVQNPIATLNVAEDVREQVFAYLETAQPTAHIFFSEYVLAAVLETQNTGTDLEATLDNFETQARQDLETAAARQGREISVSLPGNMTMQPEEVSLQFGVSMFGRGAGQSTSTTNVREDWLQVIAEFVESSPQVGHIEFVATSQVGFQAQTTDTLDCFYQPTRVSMGGDVSHLLTLDPLLSVDANLTRDDFAGSTLQVLSKDGFLYGLPLHIQPEVMVYDTQQFEARSAVQPYQGWSVADFEQSLRSLKLNPGDPPPLDPRSFGGAHIFTLVAAYGGLLIDYRTDPPTIDFTSDASRNAVRQVLDLAREGYLQFDELTPASHDEFFENLDGAAMYIQFLSDPYNARIEAVNTHSEQYGIVTFPQGVDYSAIVYDVGAGYITSHTQHAEPCYEFLKFLSERPDLFDTMPARRSVIDSDILRQLEDEETITLYREIDALLQRPDVVEFPSIGILDQTQSVDYFLQYWIFRAMDRYVFENADLDAELEVAQEYTLAYQQCEANLAPYDPTTESLVDYVVRYIQCAVDVDETVLESFGNLLETSN